MLTPHFPLSSTAKKLPVWNTNINDFLPEVVEHILSFLDLETLIVTRFCCKEWLSLAQSLIRKKLKDTSISLTFEQENKWKFYVDFHFSSVNLATSRVCFQVKQLKTRRCFYGLLLENPKVTNISSPYHSLNQWMNRGLPIKRPGVFLSFASDRSPKNRWTVTYQVSKVSPVQQDDLVYIDGERWVTPLVFECSLLFLVCDSRPTFFRKVAKIMPIRRSSLMPVIPDLKMTV